MFLLGQSFPQFSLISSHSIASFWVAGDKRELWKKPFFLWTPSWEHIKRSLSWRFGGNRMRNRVSHIMLEIFGFNAFSMSRKNHDLICTTPRLCQKNMTPVALRGRGTTSTYNCFPATSLYFKSKVLASLGRGSTETTRLQHGSSMFGDTHAFNAHFNAHNTV